MLRLADRIDRLSTAIGRAAAWLVLAVVLIQFAVVLLRYVFGTGSIRLQESVVYAHAFAFLLAAAWTLKADAHVRVDVFYRDAGLRGRALVDLLGTLFLLFPMVGLILWTSIPYVARSWAILEGSQETSGLPLVFLLKTAIPLFAALLILQGVAEIVRAAGALRAPDAGR
ncbi:MAG: TRAP transporter small permease subunit [Bradyrhizobiaceae bacterium]|nr:TRAP transporter small permease subunit [Bradyrhizobiaceae bacterium]